MYDEHGLFFSNEKYHQFHEDMLHNPKKYAEDSKRIAKTFHGWVIGRRWESGGKLVNNTYYPEMPHGKPPFLFNTKTEAEKHFNKLKSQNKFPATESNVVIFRYTPDTYLDRF